MLSSALVSVGPVSAEHEAPPTGVVVSALGTTFVAGLSAVNVIVTVTCFPGVASAVETSGVL